MGKEASQIETWYSPRFTSGRDGDSEEEIWDQVVADYQAEISFMCQKGAPNFHRRIVEGDCLENDPDDVWVTLDEEYLENVSADDHAPLDEECLEDASDN
jgi:hypothetical protein